MSRDKYKYVLVEKDIHDKIKLYSEATGIKIYKIASEAIKEYIENHPVKDDEQVDYPKSFEDYVI